MPEDSAMRRPPRPSLRPFVRELWISRRDAPAGEGASSEVNLPDGSMHLVFRVEGGPVLLLDREDPARVDDVGFAAVGGARSTFYVRDISTAAISVGAQLQPGAARLLFGAPAHELAERHTPLAYLWGTGAAEAHQRLLEAGTPYAMLDTLEAILAERLPRIRALHPAVAVALDRLAAADRVDEIVAATGYSHRRFIELFEQSVGLTPKRYARVRRFDRVLRLAANAQARWADIALEAGFSDQSHFSREFVAFSGMTPDEYRRSTTARLHHVPQVNFLQDERRRRG
jgi:AraC-like DNA-binding protein